MYKFERVVVNAGIIRDAYDRAAAEVQDKLDAGYKKGWKLISFQESPALVDNKDLVFYFVWDTDNK